MEYDRSVSMYDEGYAPIELEQKLKSDTLGKGALIDDFFSEN